MSLRNYLDVFKNYYQTFIIIIIAVLIIVLGTSWLWSMGSQALLSFSVVKKGEGQDQYGGYYSIQADELFATSSIDWLKTPQTVKKIYQLAGEDVAEEDLPKLAKSIIATEISTDSIQIKYKSKDTEKLKRFIDATLKVIDQRNKEIAKSPEKMVRVMELSSSPLVIPIKIDYLLVGLIGLILGLILAILGIFAFQFFNPLLLSPAMGLNILGHNLDYLVLSKKLKISTGLKSQEAEKLRIFRSKILTDESERSKSFLIFGADSGKALEVSFLLTDSLARIGKEILLVESDFKNPKMNKIFSLNNKPGWENYLTKSVKLSNLVKESKTQNLSFLPAAKTIADSADLIFKKDPIKIIKQLKNEKNFAILFGPPFNLFSDSLLFLTAADSTILIIELGKTKISTMYELKKIFHEKSIKPKLIFLA